MKWIKLTLLVSVALLAGVLALAWLLFIPAAAPEHRLFVNGQILSMDADDQVFEAMSVRGDRIHRLGSDEEMRALAADNTVITDLQGRTLLPGFVDAHGHFPGSGIDVVSVDLRSPPVGEVTSIEQLQDALRARLDGKSDDNWLAGFGYDDTLLREKRHPTRADLDEVSSDIPIYITHISLHMGVGNSRAFELMGITADSEDPVGGVIVRLPNSREPAGLLEETAQGSATAEALSFSMLDSIGILLSANREYAAQGVTTAQSGGVDRSMAESMAVPVQIGLVGPRLVLFPFEHLLGEDLLDGSFDSADLASDKLIIGPVKIVADGSIQGFTGYLAEPYYTPYKGDPEYRGYPAVPRDELIEIVARYHAAGFQLAIHGNGDASIDDILDAFELAQAQNPVEDPRLILVHAQMAREDQLLRMRELGVTPSFFSAHTYYWGDRHRDIFMGPERAARMSPTRSAQDLGLRYSVHLDTPVVPMLPLQLLWSTVNRISTGGDVIGAEQRVSVMQALRAMTIEAAWQVFQEDNIGSLESGKLADIVILDGDPLKEPDVRDIAVVETIVGGRTIYQR
ncbi:MAG: amidohydrolase [Halieaceae bacterium]